MEEVEVELLWKSIFTRFQIDFFFFPLFLAFGAMQAVPASPKWREKHPAFPGCFYVLGTGQLAIQPPSTSPKTLNFAFY